MSIFGSLFSKKIKVKDEDLQDYFCVKHKKSGKRIYLNTELIVPENCLCVFCYRNKPCDVIGTGEYQLNGNSLPMLYKKGGYNKPNKRNYIPNYFFANIWFASTNAIWLDFDIENFVVKDRIYGKQKLCFSMKINIKIDDATKFFKNLLYERPRISKKRVISEIIYWFKKDIKKHLKRQGYNIEDYMCYTRGFNQELHSLLSDRFVPMGLTIIETDLEDIIMPDELVREITDNRNLSYHIYSTMKDFDLAMNNDGFKTQVDFARSTEQMQGSIAEKYMTPSQDTSIKMDAFDEIAPYGVNQFSNDYQTGKLEEITSGIDAIDNNPFLNDLYGNELTSANANMNINQYSNTTSGYINNQSTQNGGNGTNMQQEDDIQSMYNMADESMGEQQDAYTTLYGQSTAFKLCTKCGKQVPVYASFCPYCGNGDLKHNI
ncbi:MAG: SPFH domain-containing protein [Clostridia bacterium]|nr:SPFH domain-containing protein [Clostridia bacterium]